jgi:uncharacterized paraquat-inducible protein A
MSEEKKTPKLSVWEKLKQKDYSYNPDRKYICMRCQNIFQKPYCHQCKSNLDKPHLKYTDFSNQH